MTDTRAAFEQRFLLTIRQKKQHRDGSYINPIVQAWWSGYQSGAQQPAQTDTREPFAWYRQTDITELTDSEPETDGWTPLFR